MSDKYWKTLSWDDYTTEEILEYQRGFKNLMLAPTIELYWALQRGESVPIDQLRPEAVKAYGLRAKS